MFQRSIAYLKYMKYVIIFIGNITFENKAIQKKKKKPS